jgi:hypothetical protein
MGLATFNVNGAGCFSLDENGVLSRYVDGDSARQGEKIAVDLPFRKLFERAFAGVVDNSVPDDQRISSPRNGGFTISTGAPAVATQPTFAIRFFDREARLVLELSPQNIATLDPRPELRRWMLEQLDEAQA